MSKEIAIVMGFPASGKSTTVQQFVDKGYTRLNRDSVGGSMDELNRLAEKTLLDTDQLVLDNLYPSVASRKAIIDLGKRHKIPVNCYCMSTSLEDAQLNACLRMIKMLKHVPEPNDCAKHKHPNIFPVAVIYKYRKEFQQPTTTEGFNQVTMVPFKRVWGPEYKKKAIIVDYDGTLRLSTGKQKYPVLKGDIQIMPNRLKVLAEYKKKGYLILGASNQSGVAKGVLSMEDCKQRFIDTNEMLDDIVDGFHFCPHKVPPITCYCRKPNPAIGAIFIETYKLDPAECTMVGDMGSDKTFAARCGFKYMDQSVFFGS
jgi:D-glycero-D-manno-heptose 1,7-bisphosphate phosphatase